VLYGVRDLERFERDGASVGLVAFLLSSKLIDSRYNERKLSSLFTLIQVE
jgi:hypothetical protein